MGHQPGVLSSFCNLAGVFGQLMVPFRANHKIRIASLLGFHVNIRVNWVPRYLYMKLALHTDGW